VIYADILISWFLAAMLEIYTQHFTRRLHFTQQSLLFHVCCCGRLLFLCTLSSAEMLPVEWSVVD
jgi:hypothetical protein